MFNKGNMCKMLKQSQAIQEDKEVLEDLLSAAVNDAVRRVEQTNQDKMGGLAAGINLPPGFKFP